LAAQVLGLRNSVAVVLALGSLVGAASASPLRSGLHGYVEKGPITPVCRSDTSCTGPAVGVIVTFTRPDGTSVSVKTDATGFYRVILRGAIYRVTTSYVRDRTPFPAHIKVRAGHDDRLDFFLDTGIQ
jgi:hypothetical protein